MKYVILYLYYNEYNQFEGCWNQKYSMFKTKAKAFECIKKLKKNFNYKSIHGPYVKVKEEK